MCEDDKTWERNEESDPYYGEEYTPGFFDNMNHIESEDDLCKTQGDQAGEDIQEDGFWSDIRDIIGQCFQKQPSLYFHGGDEENVQREFYYNLKDFEAASRVTDQLSKGEYVFPREVDRVVYEFDPKFKTYPEEAPYVIELVEGKASGHTYYDLIISSVYGFEVVSERENDMERLFISSLNTLKDCYKKLEIRLMVREEPLLILTLLDSDCSIRHEYDSRCFFTKKINRMMIHELKFAKLMAKLFFKYSARANIYKSVAYSIVKDHACWVPFTLKQFEKYEDAYDLIRDNASYWFIRKECMTDMNFCFSLVEFSKNIEDQDLPLLMEKTNIISSSLSSDDPFLRFVGLWYRQIFSGLDLDLDQVEFWASRYAEKYRLTDHKVSLRIPYYGHLKFLVME